MTTIPMNIAFGTEGRAILAQVADVPVARGDVDGGSDLGCAQCSRVIVENVLPEHFNDIWFICRCGGLNELPPSYAPPIGGVALEPRIHFISETISLPVPMVSTLALDKWGKRVVQMTELVGDRPGAPATVQSRYALLEEVRDLVGRSSYEQIMVRHQRSEKSPTPSNNPHPLAELVAIVDPDGGWTGPEYRLLEAVFELRFTRDLLRFAASDRLWPDLRAELSEAEGFRHTFAVLTLLAIATAEQNPIYLAPTSDSQRMPDLRRQVDLTRNIPIEVKSPRALRRPTHRFTTTEALETVEKARKKAGTGMRGQLSPERSGILAIVGLGLTAEHLDRLEQGAKEMFARRRRPHLAAVLLSSYSTVYEIRAGETSIRSTVAMRIAENPTATGDVYVGPKSHAPPRPVQRGADARVGHNDPCWCGSGKKFKKCHGA